MLRSIKKLSQFKILARDGEIGKIYEILFDDKEWTIRYLVVNTGKWLPGRKVLIASHAFGKPDWDNMLVPVGLTKEEVEQSPEIAMDRPVYRQYQIKLHNYYGWPYFWAAGSGIVNTLPLEQLHDEEENSQNKDDPHLRSTRELIGYRIQAKDGELGLLDDFLFDDENNSIHYLVIDIGKWLSGKKVLVPRLWTNKASWRDELVSLDLTMEDIEKSPEFNPSKPLGEEEEAELYAFYGQERFRQ